MITAEKYLTTVESLCVYVTHTLSPAIGPISDERWEQMQRGWRCESALRHGAADHERRGFFSTHSLIMQLDEIKYRRRHYG
jgi:hypothetical protein